MLRDSIASSTAFVAEFVFATIGNLNKPRPLLILLASLCALTAQADVFHILRTDGVPRIVGSITVNHACVVAGVCGQEDMTGFTFSSVATFNKTHVIQGSSFATQQRTLCANIM